MDRLFCIQKDYVENPIDPDGIILFRLLKQLAKQNCDSVKITNAIDSYSGKIIPVGSLEFVQHSLNSLYGNIQMKPIEVPVPLRLFCCREYMIIQGKNIPSHILSDNEKWFIKDADNLKGFTNILCIGSCEPFIRPDTNYVVSQKIEIYSEYRVFVWKDNIQAIQNYNGMPDVFPNIQTVKNMITTYAKYSHPQAYTLDVAVTNDFQTAIMEIHPFVSCGLYGFYNEKIPDMLESGVNWYLSQNFNEFRQF